MGTAIGEKILGVLDSVGLGEVARDAKLRIRNPEVARKRKHDLAFYGRFVKRGGRVEQIGDRAGDDDGKAGRTARGAGILQDRRGGVRTGSAERVVAAEPVRVVRVHTGVREVGGGVRAAVGGDRAGDAVQLHAG